MRVILIGKSSGRLDCLAEAITRSKRTELFILTNLENPGLRDKGLVFTGPTEDPAYIAMFVDMIRSPDPIRTIAVISNEESLAAGVADRLIEIGIPTVGPVKAAAQIETSKIFMRTLVSKRPEMAQYSPAWGAYSLQNGYNIEPFIKALNTLRFDAVIKPDGLTGGKGVRIQGEHLHSLGDVIDYCKEILVSGDRVLIETRLNGQEFSRMAFSDGNTVIPMPAVQDHKRVGEGDKGVNTGGMGSYSDIDHSLPFLTGADLTKADWLNQQVVKAIAEDTGQPFQGILYGNFIATSDGIKLIEYNARFGDPEVMNVLPLLETDFADICLAIATKTLTEDHVKFAHKATVCKYLLPAGYPFDPSPGRIDTSGIVADPDLRIYYGSLDGDQLTGSRALAVVGIADYIYAAEAIAERAAGQARGPLYHRSDIGTQELIQQRVDHLRGLRSNDDLGSRSSPVPGNDEW